MVVMVGCECEGLPAHDHFNIFMIQRLRERNKSHGLSEFEGVPEHGEINHLWVDWKAFARSLMLDPPS